ncbi:MAG TPA: hypothetical protein VK988_22470 [Acidimicrobiales bacterium]|nr:hypothetical protein [Acidimicrobiales bacterium]
MPVHGAARFPGMAFAFGWTPCIREVLATFLGYRRGFGGSMMVGVLFVSGPGAPPSSRSGAPSPASDGPI